MPVREISFSDLSTADLIVDAVYKGGLANNAGDDPIAKLLPCGNQGGFRFCGGTTLPSCRMAILFSTFSEPDWPDLLEPETGRFVYFGDNRRPGHELHETRGGNKLLRMCFEALHAGLQSRLEVPPFFVFSRGPERRDVQFKGLAVPGADGVPATDDLVAIWRTSDGLRFQNYRAIFTILDVSVIRREWINRVVGGQPASDCAPSPWLDWRARGIYQALKAPKILRHRTKLQQLPNNQEGIEIIRQIHEHFKDDPFQFEKCAVELVQMLDPNFIGCELTRPWRDGGRDAVGEYRIGTTSDPLAVEFALEAKCYALESSVGVKEVSRLISRLKYRQFGVFVTTSYIHEQAYKEVKEDEHPVLVLAARDILELLRSKGYATSSSVKDWLTRRFPQTS
jgi:hypothetical protein